MQCVFLCICSLHLFAYSLMSPTVIFQQVSSTQCLSAFKQKPVSQLHFEKMLLLLIGLQQPHWEGQCCFSAQYQNLKTEILFPSLLLFLLCKVCWVSTAVSTLAHYESWMWTIGLQSMKEAPWTTLASTWQVFGSISLVPIAWILHLPWAAAWHYQQVQSCKWKG